MTVPRVWQPGFDRSLKLTVYRHPPPKLRPEEQEPGSLGYHGLKAHIKTRDAATPYPKRQYFKEEILKKFDEFL